MTDFLDLPSLRTLAVDDVGDHYRVQAEGCVHTTACPGCGAAAPYGHGSQPQRYLDAPARGKPTVIEIDRRRYRCRACRKTFFEELPALDGGRLATKRLVRYIEARCLGETFAALARDTGLDEKTIRLIFDERVARLEKEVRFETPEILGIDELKIGGEYRATLTNVGQLALFDLLPSRRKADLLAYFQRIPDKDRVRVVAMDLWGVYRQVVAETLPGRVIVADKFHVVRMATAGLERAIPQSREANGTAQSACSQQWPARGPRRSCWLELSSRGW